MKSSTFEPGVSETPKFTEQARMFTLQIWLKIISPKSFVAFLDIPQQSR